VEVFGGDGGDVTVEPQNPDRTIEEYVYLAMSASTDGGHVWHDACDTGLGFVLHGSVHLAVRPRPAGSPPCRGAR